MKREPPPPLCPDEAVAQVATIPERLSFARGFYGWTQSQLAEASGVDQPTISRLEQSARDPRISTLVRLAAALRVTLDWLATGKGPAFGASGAPFPPR